MSSIVQDISSNRASSTEGSWGNQPASNRQVSNASTQTVSQVVDRWLSANSSDGGYASRSNLNELVSSLQTLAKSGDTAQRSSASTLASYIREVSRNVPSGNASSLAGLQSQLDRESAVLSAIDMDVGNGPVRERIRAALGSIQPVQHKLSTLENQMTTATPMATGKNYSAMVDQARQLQSAITELTRSGVDTSNWGLKQAGVELDEAMNSFTAKMREVDGKEQLLLANNSGQPLSAEQLAGIQKDRDLIVTRFREEFANLKVELLQNSDVKNAGAAISRERAVARAMNIHESNLTTMWDENSPATIGGLTVEDLTEQKQRLEQEYQALRGSTERFADAKQEFLKAKINAFEDAIRKLNAGEERLSVVVGLIAHLKSADYALKNGYIYEIDREINDLRESDANPGAPDEKTQKTINELMTQKEGYVAEAESILASTRLLLSKLSELGDAKMAALRNAGRID